MFATPFAFMWNGVHLLISPAASHSGWEDHFQVQDRRLFINDVHTIKEGIGVCFVVAMNNKGVKNPHAFMLI